MSHEYAFLVRFFTGHGVFFSHTVPTPLSVEMDMLGASKTSKMCYFRTGIKKVITESGQSEKHPSTSGIGGTLKEQARENSRVIVAYRAGLGGELRNSI